MDLQVYKGGIKSNQPIGLTSLETFLSAHSEPSDTTVQLLDSIALASSQGNKKKKTMLKETLPFITPAVIVKKYRRYTDIERFTGIASLDFDGLDNARELKYHLFSTYPQIIASYISPSGKGVKALIRIPISKDVEEYQDYYRALEDEFEGIYGFDPAPKNAVLPLFYSYDYMLLQREDASVWSRKKIVEKDFHQAYPLPPRPYKKNKDNDRSGQRAINTVRKMINQIVDGGHPQLRGACLILGTRVGAGYLLRQEAEQEVEYLIRSNSYLQKGIKGYITTSLWAIDEGMKTPKYY